MNSFMIYPLVAVIIVIVGSIISRVKTRKLERSNTVESYIKDMRVGNGYAIAWIAITWPAIALVLVILSPIVLITLVSTLISGGNIKDLFDGKEVRGIDW